MEKEIKKNSGCFNKIRIPEELTWTFYNSFRKVISTV